MNRCFAWALAAVGLAACGAPQKHVAAPRNTTTVLVPRPATGSPVSAAPPPATREPCEISGKRAVGPVALYVTRDETRSVARLPRPELFELTWSRFQRGTSRTAVEFSAPKLVRFSGFADIRGDWFDATHPFDLVPGCVSTWTGAQVRPVEDIGHALVVSVRTPFATPERLEATVDCTAVSFDDLPESKPDLPEVTGTLQQSSTALDLHPAVGAPRALQVTFSSPSALHSVVAREPGWVRVLERGESSVALAWVPQAQLRPPPRLGRSHRTRPPRIRRDWVRIDAPRFTVLADTPLSAGAPGALVPFAEIPAGAEVQVTRREGEWASIRFPDLQLSPGDLGPFWIEARFLGPAS